MTVAEVRHSAAHTLRAHRYGFHEPDYGDTEGALKQSAHSTCVEYSEEVGEGGQSLGNNSDDLHICKGQAIPMKIDKRHAIQV